MLTIKIIHEIHGLPGAQDIGEKLDRLIELLEGQLQAQIDQITKQINASTDAEEAAIKQDKGD